MVNTLLNKIAILGSGIAGISAAYHLLKRNVRSVIFEKDDDWGGLCGNFTINGFRFDRFVHFSFTPNEEEKKLFAKPYGMVEHTPLPGNYYHGIWLRHPAQNNLAPLSADEKVKIILDFINRKKKKNNEIKNYAEWLRVQYGNYFAEHFPFLYTRKYWGVEAETLETKWIGVRMYSPDIEQVLKGSYATQDECFYFAKKMYYPRKGGFKSILSSSRNGLDIKLKKKVIKIALQKHKIYFDDGTSYGFDKLISTLPLPEIVKIIDCTPKEVLAAASRLHWTCGYQVSLGFNKPDIAKYLWFYIYDQDVLASRVYSPNLKSDDNVPEGCSSYQAEVFFDCKSDLPSKETVLENTLQSLKRICNFSEKDLVVCDIRFEPYANVTFTQNIYVDRQIVLDWLDSNGILSIGRFGKWDYLWTHQAFETGEKVIV